MNNKWIFQSLISLFGVILASIVAFGCSKKDSSSATSSSTIVAPTCPSGNNVAVGHSDLAVPLGHIPASVKKLKDQGKLADSQQLLIQIGMPLNNRSDLQQLLNDLYDVKSPVYHQFLTPNEFRTRFAPTPSQVADVTSFLTSHGLQNVTLNPSGYMLKAQGSIGSLNSTFLTEIHQFQDSSGNSHFAPSIEPTLQRIFRFRL